MTADTLGWLDRLDTLATKATPRPWIRKWASGTVHWPGGDDALQSQADIDYAVALVNAAPRLVALARLGAAGLDVELLAEAMHVWTNHEPDGSQSLHPNDHQLGNQVRHGAAGIAAEYGRLTALRAELEGRG